MSSLPASSPFSLSKGLKASMSSSAILNIVIKTVVLPSETFGGRRSNPRVIRYDTTIYFASAILFRGLFFGISDLSLFVVLMAEVQLLVLGPEGVGKTVMLKRLKTLTAQQNLAQAQQKQELGEAPSTVPTIGVNLVTVTHHRKKYTFRELGGAMGPIWNNYFKEAACIVYVIDIANQTQIASACIQLLEVLSSKQTQEMAVLLIFNKIDSPDCMSMSEISAIIRLREVLANAKQDITVLECSFRDGTGLDRVLKWLLEKCSVSSLAK